MKPEGITGRPVPPWAVRREVDRLSTAGAVLHTLLCLLPVAVGVTCLTWVLIVLPPILQGIYGGN
ncbi:MAG TPA: hypothetical protein VFE78_11390 [Gemmataceae bacterium]|jgi:hypothetical protein|nr:hypothetical protein [Gemmataceae bacterium]